MRSLARLAEKCFGRVIKMSLRVLFVGLGSAGQRHLRNLRRLKGDDLEVMAYRVEGLTRMFDDQMQIVPGKNLEEEQHIRVFHDYAEALAQKPDIVFITNQNSRHMQSAMQAARAGANLFIEKPISHTMEGIDELEAETARHGKIAYVGYQNRLHPCIRYAKRLLEEGRLGDLFMVYSELGEYLPRMHPWQDYRTMHEANASLGGGVVICQLHELDYLYSLFGMPEEVYAIGGKRSHLELDVEDSATALCRYRRNGKEFAVNVHLDFLQTPPVRHCKICGEHGRFEFDLIGNEGILYLEDGTVEKVLPPEGFVRNDMFLEELKLFLTDIEKGKSSLDIAEGKKSIAFALGIKESMEKKLPVRFA